MIIIITLIYRTIPRKHLQARGAVHYQHQNPLDNQKSTSAINAYINIKKARMKQTNKQTKTKKRKEEAKYCKCVHRY